MSTPIFDTQYKKTSVWSAQGALIYWSAVDANGKAASSGGSKSLPIIANTLTIGYSRATSQIFSLNQVAGNLTKYILLGAPSGQLQIGSMFGPSTKLQEFLKEAGNSCKTLNIDVYPYAGLQCDDGTGSSGARAAKISLTGCTLGSMGLTLTAQGAMTQVQMPFVFTFTGLEWTDTAKQP